MQRSLLFVLVCVLGCDDKALSSHAGSPDGSAGGGPPRVQLTARVSDLSSTVSESGLILDSAALEAVCRDTADGRSCNLTPSGYQIALASFRLVTADDSEIDLLNLDGGESEYSITNPLVVNFAEPEQIALLLDTDQLPPGRYVGYKMTPAYFEMQLPVHFNLTCESERAIDRAVCDALVAESRDGIPYRSFRMVFNNTAPLLKRDFIVEVEPGSDRWYWMLAEPAPRAVLTAVEADRPMGPILDLFHDSEFWGTDDAVVELGTHSRAGGLDARLEGAINLDSGESSQILLTINVEQTMNFYDVASAPHSDALDIGNDCNRQDSSACDLGLHPFLPRFIGNEQPYDPTLSPPPRGGDTDAGAIPSPDAATDTPLQDAAISSADAS